MLIVGAIELGLRSPGHIVIGLADDDLWQVQPGVLGKGLVAAQVSELAILPKDCLWNIVHDRLQELLTVAQRLFGLFVIAHIQHLGNRLLPTARLPEQHGAHFHVAFLAVFVDEGNLVICRYLFALLAAHVVIGDKPAAVFVEQLAEVGADQFGLTVAGDVSELFVGVDEVELVIDNHDAAVSGFHDRAEALFGLVRTLGQHLPDHTLAAIERLPHEVAGLNRLD